MCAAPSLYIGIHSGLNTWAPCRCQNRRVSGRGPELWILDHWGIRDEGDDVYLGSGPLEEVKPYVLLDYIEVYRMIIESIYHEIR